MSADNVTRTAREPRRAWSAGHGAIRHTPLPRRRVAGMVAALGERGESGHGPGVWEILHAADRVASAGMSAGTGQVYVVTSDNTVYAFGIPLAIN